jgi:hypothetical protein
VLTQLSDRRACAANLNQTNAEGGLRNANEKTKSALF